MSGSSTSVPPPVFGATGFIAPAESAILAGVKADINAAFGGKLNQALTAPQGQIASSETAIIGNANDTFVAMANGVDPAFANGRMQDAIGRIYFLTRLPDQSTVTQVACTGLVNTPIPTGSLLKAADGNLYYCLSGGTIPVGGTITLTFACQITGPIACPAQTFVIYGTIPGWDTAVSAADGTLGNLVESRSAFETRRQQAVMANSSGFTTSILGSVLGNDPVTGAQNVPGILDALVVDNANSYPVGVGPAASIIGSISGTTLTVSLVNSGAVAAGQTVTGSDGMGVPVAAGTTISSGSGVAWTVNNAQTVASTTLNLGGVILAPNSVYVAALGGTDADVAQAIWLKKPPGCALDGNTSVTVYDANVQYAPPGVPYVVTFERPPPLPFLVSVVIANSPLVPSNATALIQAAIIAAFAGADGGPRARIGSAVLASRFYAGLIALGSWAEIVSLLLGSTNAPAAAMTASIGASFTGTGSGTNLTTTGTTGLVSAGDVAAGPGVPAGTSILSQTSGVPGGDGVYVTSQTTTASGAALTTASTILNVTAVGSGIVGPGQVLFATGIADGTTVIGQISGAAGGIGTYTVTPSETFASGPVIAVAATLTRVQASIAQAPTITADTIKVTLI